MAGTRLHAAFGSADDAREALSRLVRDGVPAADVEVRSSVPLEHGVLPESFELHSRVPWMALLGGFLGGTGAFMVAKLTSEAYALPTGGMPIVSLPPFAVITFEGIAIGAILCTVATVFFEGRLPQIRSRPGPLDEHLAGGDIVLAIPWSDGGSRDWTANAVATALQEGV